MQLAMFALASMAFQVIRVVPTGYGLVSGRPSPRTPAPTVTPGQLSLAVAVPGFSTAEQRPGSFFAETSAGQPIVGGWRSRTVTLKLQVAGLPAASRAVEVTIVTPFGKKEPEA